MDLQPTAAAVQPHSGRSLIAMSGRRGGVLAASIAAQLTLIGQPSRATAQERAAAAPLTAAAIPCGSDVVARARVTAVIDGRNFILEDGREVHLAGIEVPPLPTTNAAQGASGGVAAKAALAVLASGADAELRQAEVASDRYGRIVAYADVLRNGSRRSAQAELISAGLARVGGDIQSQACAHELLDRESIARKAKLGLWANRHYQPLRADDSPEILAQRGHFALVEGKVLSVHESGATVYVNFGRRWSQDFAVTIRKRNAADFAVGVDLNALTGRYVLVRGWIQAHRSGSTEGPTYWRSPWIEADRPEQIELIGHD